jgi:L-amino acid N-acyltransferase YncA
MKSETVPPSSRGHQTTARQVLVRSSREEDIPAITTIYAYHVLNGTGSFETTPPDEEEMKRRRSVIAARGLPYLIVEIDGTVVGYAYADLYRTRAAYRHTLEDSIYIHPDHVGKGIGRLLLSDLLEQCERAGCRQMICMIGDSDNRSSIRLHQSLGFLKVGALFSVGFKFGRWLDVVFMQRALGPGDTNTPGDA